MSTILDKIVATKWEEISAARAQLTEHELESRCRDLPSTRDFHGALAATNGVRVIAEIKKASPSAGIIRADFDPIELAKAYRAGGAACLSVLTDRQYFQGDLKYLQSVRKVVDLPLLRKDFIVDRYQLLEARFAGADAVLLIAECLTPAKLRELHDAAAELGLQTLIELYDAENLPAVIASGTRMIGVNNRDLRTFVVDLDHTVRMAPHIPSGCLLVGESGIKTPSDVKRLHAAGVKAILVGESLMRQPNVTLALQSLMQLQ